MQIKVLWLVDEDGVSSVTPESLTNAVKGGLDLATCKLFPTKEEADAEWLLKRYRQRLLDATGRLRPSIIAALCVMAEVAGTHDTPVTLFRQALRQALEVADIDLTPDTFRYALQTALGCHF